MTNQRRTPSISKVILGATAVASIALSLHFNSLVEDYKQSQIELNAKYTKVLVENEDLHKQNKKVSGLLERSQMEIERLNKETDNLHMEVQKQQKVIHNLKKPIQHSQPSRGETDGEWIYFRLTYYDNEKQSTGKRPGDKGYGVTASGRPTTEGVSIAVDMNVIPLGTWVLIRWPDGHLEKRRADDTGSAIKGYDIDCYVPHATITMGDPVVAVRILQD